MFQINEVMTLVFGIIGVGLMITFMSRAFIPRYQLLIVAYCCFLASNACTVLEDFWLPDLFNLLEHVSYLATGVVAVVAAFRYAR